MAFYEHKNYIQRDIRTMFSRVTEDVELNEPLSQSSNFKKEKDITHYPKELFDEISNFLAIQESLGTRCKICEKLFECPKTYYHKSEPIDLSSWVQPDLSILASITVENLEIFEKSLAPKCAELEDDSGGVFDNFQFITQLEKSADRAMEVVDKSFYKSREDDSEANRRKIEEKGCAFDTHRPNTSFTRLDKSPSKTPSNVKETTISPDLFDESSDLFSPHLQIDDPKTPSSEQGDNPIVEDSGSPVICGLPWIQKIKVRRKLLSHHHHQHHHHHQSSEDLSNKLNLVNHPKTSPKKDIFKAVDDSSDLIDISDVCDLSEFGLNNIVTHSSVENKKDTKEMNKSDIDISDICDLSFFGWTKTQIDTENKKDKEMKESDIDISDICDLSFFGFTKTEIDTGVSTVLNRISDDTIEEDSKSERAKQCPREDFDIKDICDMSIFFQESISKKNTETSQLKSDTNDNNRYTIAVQGDTASAGTDYRFNANKPSAIIDLTDSDTPKRAVRTSNLSLKKQGNEVSQAIKQHLDSPKPSRTTQKKNNNPAKKKSKFNLSLGSNSDDDFETTTSIPIFAKSRPCPSSASTKKDKMKKSLKKQGKEVSQPIKQHLDSLKPSRTTQKKNNNPAKKKSKFNLSLGSNSDDDFETTTSIPIFAKSRPCPSSASTKKDKMKKSLKKQGKEVSQPIKQHLDSPKPSRTTEKKNNNPAKKKSKFNLSLGSNSDDDFETTTSITIFAKSRPCPSSASTKKDKMKKTVSLKRKKPKKLHEYLDDEAELAEDGSIVISEDEDSGEDCFETSFVDDGTQDFLNNTIMHAEYLKTTKSPPRTRGKFKIPEGPRHNVTNVFSQEVDNADDTYLNDSFLVNTQDVDSPPTTDVDELSDLEILEMKLEQKKKSKK